MGRAMLIIVTSLFFVFTITQVNTLRRQAEIGSLSNQFYHLNEARNAANAGVEMALADLKIGYDNLTVSDTSSIATYKIGQRTAMVTVEAAVPVKVYEGSEFFPFLDYDHGVKTSYRITSIGQSSLEESKVRVQAVSYRGMPKIDGALSLIGEGSQLRFGGNAGTVCGFDISPDRTSVGPTLSKQQIQSLACQDYGSPLNKPGIATNFEEESDTYDLNGTNLDKVVKGDPPRDVVEESDVSFWLEFARYLSANATRICTGTCGNTTTTENSVTLIKTGGSLQLNGTVTYNGIILVESGGQLQLTGTITMNSLILILGPGTRISGTPFIRGGIVFVNSGSNLELEETNTVDPLTGELNGNMKIFYDSSIVKDIVLGHPSLTPPRFYTEFFID